MFEGSIRFADRKDAGIRLAAELSDHSGREPLILALPRGGVPVAFEVAKALDAQLDLLMVRKIGAPGYEELGIGAVVDGVSPQLVLNEDIVQQMAPSREYLRAEMQRQLTEIECRRQAYLGDRRPIPIQGRTVIVVDDGIATGGTMKAALTGIRKSHPVRLIMAVPVAPPSTIRELARECDETVCLATPEPFGAVGAFYRDFTQTSDAEVIALLESSREFGATGSRPAAEG